jgi:hypothetical protein
LKALDNVLSKLEVTEVRDVVILTPGKVEYSLIADLIEQESDTNNGYYTYKHNGFSYRFTTCIKFKGLEADAIVMIDLDKDSFTGFKGLEFYVGTSRAKQYLDMVATIPPEKYAEVITTLDPDAPIKPDHEKMRKVLSSLFEVEIETN